MHRLELAKLKKENGASDEIERAEAAVRDTYYQHDQELSNPETRKRFEQSPPALDPDQQEVVESLRAEGLSVVPFSKLFAQDLWGQLVDYSRAFEARVEEELSNPVKKAKEGAKARLKKVKPGKPGKKKFVLKRDLVKGAELTPGNPWFTLGTSPRMLDIVNSYLGLWAKLTYVDQWYSVPGGSEAERLGSQRWHRDYNDQYLVKVFLYMHDVDEGSGPFEYVPGSARSGPYAGEWPWQPLGETYPDAAEFQQRIPDSAARTLTAPAGTLIFCDTSGFHRGGFATDTRRVLGVFNYVSQAALESLVDRNFEVDASKLSDKPEAVKFALT